MNKKILVVGGTGLLGYPVAVAFKKAGYDVKILTREPEKASLKTGNSFDLVEGDVRSVYTLKNALRGSYGVHINLNAGTFRDLEEVEVKGTANIAKVAAEYGLKKITLISGLGVNEQNFWSPFVRSKLDAEKALKISGLNYTIFKCTHFMESLALYIRNKKAMVFGNQSNKIHWIAASDYADMVVRSFESENSDHESIPVLGPGAFTMEEALTKYIEKLDPAIRIQRLSLGYISLIATVTFSRKLKFLYEAMKYFDKVAESVSREEMPGLLGKPGTTFDQWLHTIDPALDP